MIFTAKSPIWQLCRGVVNQLQTGIEIEGGGAARLEELVDLMDDRIPQDDGATVFKARVEKMRRAQEERDHRQGLSCCALPAAPPSPTQASSRHARDAIWHTIAALTTKSSTGSCIRRHATPPQTSQRCAFGHPFAQKPQRPQSPNRQRPRPERQ